MYRLIAFGDLSLDYANPVDTVGSGETPAAYLTLPEGGALDVYGRVRKHPGAVERTKAMRLTASDPETLSDLYMTCLACVGTRDKLTRRMADGSEHWIYARLVEMSAERSYQDARFKLYQDVTLKFVTEAPTWTGLTVGGWFLDDGYDLDDGLKLNAGMTPQVMTSSPFEFTVTIGTAGDPGRAPVRSLKISVIAGSEDITHLTINRSGHELVEFVDTIPAGEELLIDVSTAQVTLTGADAYANFRFTSAPWFTLDPGDNDITVTIEGGGSDSSIAINYGEAWY